MTRAEKFLFMTRSPGVSPTGKTTYNKEAIQLTHAMNSEYVVPTQCLDIPYDKSLIAKYSNDEVITLNFSLLKDLFECGYKFKLSNVFGLHQPLDIRMGYGQSIHSMLDHIHKHWESINLDDDSEIWKIVERFIHLPYASKILIEFEKKKAFEKIRSYVINNKARFKNILFSEKRIDYKYSDYFFIDGKIDLIRDDVNQELTIVDFKSDKSVLSQVQIKNQLMLYVLGYESMKKERISYIESYDVNETKPTRIPITDVDREAFKKELSKHENTVKTGKYLRHCDIDPDHQNKHCKGCFLWNDKLKTCNGKLNTA
jgi:DNA helicase II / ATP-dependent DNA helicase PcrA